MSSSQPATWRLPPAQDAAGLLGFVAVVSAVAVVGSLSAAGAGVQYAFLRQPDFAPPSWIFAPVWTVLYALIAVSGWLVWRRVGRLRAERWGFTCYGAQLVFNALWTPLFFGAGRLGLAFVDIATLWLATVGTVVFFARRDRLAAALLLPYLAWVSFAGVLNLSIWLLNS